MNISRGQRQRIGIARCAYYNKDIIIFDEATSQIS
ncbi:ATP-binding cassette domain-containing protein [Candidatus Pelagibacter sp. Uisw_114]